MTSKQMLLPNLKRWASSTAVQPVRDIKAADIPRCHVPLPPQGLLSSLDLPELPQQRPQPHQTDQRPHHLLSLERIQEQITQLLSLVSVCRPSVQLCMVLITHVQRLLLPPLLTHQLLEGLTISLHLHL